MSSNTEIPPAAEGDHRRATHNRMAMWYARLEDRVPAILFVEKWDAWVALGDIPSSSFDSLVAYQDEFPLQVEVTDNCVRVTDPGFGNGAMDWVVRRYVNAQEKTILLVTETDSQPESLECTLWAGIWENDDWVELKGAFLPQVQRANFFDAQVDLATLDNFELISLHYRQHSAGDLLSIEPFPNLSMECVDGKVMQEDLDPDEVAAICKAWTHYRPSSIQLQFNPLTSVFDLLP